MRFHSYFKCAECGELWVNRTDVISWLVSPKKCAQLEADSELAYQLHVTNHKLERIEQYVKEKGL